MSEAVVPAVTKSAIPEQYDALIAEQTKEFSDFSVAAFSETTGIVAEAAGSEAKIYRRLWHTIVTYGVNEADREIFQERLDGVIRSVAESGLRIGFILGLNAAKSGGEHGDGDSNEK